jgi:hypothetical protein
MCLPHSLDEVDHGDGIVGNTVVRPGQVVELSDLERGDIWLFILKGGVERVHSNHAEMHTQLGMLNELGVEHEDMEWACVCFIIIISSL